MCSPLSVSIVIKVRLRNKEKQRSLEAKKQITSNIKEAGSLESVFSLFLIAFDYYMLVVVRKPLGVPKVG